MENFGTNSGRIRCNLPICNRMALTWYPFQYIINRFLFKFIPQNFSFKLGQCQFIQLPEESTCFFGPKWLFSRDQHPYKFFQCQTWPMPIIDRSLWAFHFLFSFSACSVPLSLLFPLCLFLFLHYYLSHWSPESPSAAMAKSASSSSASSATSKCPSASAPASPKCPASACRHWPLHSSSSHHCWGLSFHYSYHFHFVFP